MLIALLNYLSFIYNLLVEKFRNISVKRNYKKVRLSLYVICFYYSYCVSSSTFFGNGFIFK